MFRFLMTQGRLILKLWVRSAASRPPVHAQKFTQWIDGHWIWLLSQRWRAGYLINGCPIRTRSQAGSARKTPVCFSVNNSVWISATAGRPSCAAETSARVEPKWLTWLSETAKKVRSNRNFRSLLKPKSDAKNRTRGTFSYCSLH